MSGFAELSAILRLSDKYDVPLLRSSMLSILSALYPDTLDKWSEKKTPPGYRTRGYDYIHALNLAVQLDLRPVLPVIMYELCCRCDLHEIAYGAGKAIAIKDRAYRKKCLLAIPQLLLAHRKSLMAYTERDPVHGPCERGAKCDSERIRWLKIDLDDADDGFVFNPLEDSNAGAWENFTACEPCRESAKQAYNNARQNLWDELPEIFDLGTWAELLASVITSPLFSPSTTANLLHVPRTRRPIHDGAADPFMCGGIASHDNRAQCIPAISSTFLPLQMQKSSCLFYILGSQLVHIIGYRTIYINMNIKCCA